MQSLKYLLGNFGDNSWLLWEGLRLKYNSYNSTYYGLYGFENTDTNLEPLIYKPFLFLAKYINALDLWNIYIVLFLLLSIYFAFKYLYSEKKNIFLAILFSIIWVSNSYFSIHSRDHLSLLAIFLYPIYMNLITELSYKKLFYKYSLIATSLLVSAYIGVFLLFGNIFWSIYNFIKKRNTTTNLDLFLSISVPLFISYFLKVTFSASAREIDNFLIFSSKPWNFIIQSQRALFNISDFEKYLPKNNIFFTYFDNEHSVTYFSLILITIFIYQTIKGKIKFTKNLYFLIFLIGISFPPYIAIKGINIYLPSYLFYELFPQLRVLSRINIFSFLIFLKIIYDSISFENLSKSKKYLVYFILILSILDLQTNYKVSKIQNNNVYEFLKNQTDIKSQVIFYPYDIADESIKNMIYFQRKVINPSGYEVNNFNSKEFTKNLSCEEIKKYPIGTENLFLIEKVGFDILTNDKKYILSNNELQLFEVTCK